MQTARFGYTATLRSNGNVLVTGGVGITGTALASAEIFDPTKGTFTTTASMQTTRRGHTATLLANGMVLVAGGFDANSKALDTAELYDLVAGCLSGPPDEANARPYRTVPYPGLGRRF
jgi:galactose oxidase-like protein